jgi:hypothetical protein
LTIGTFFDLRKTIAELAIVFPNTVLSYTTEADFGIAPGTSLMNLLKACG